MIYLLDTCVISDLFKKIPSVLDHFKAVSPQQIHISALTVMEVEYGLKLNPERVQRLLPLWESFLGLIEVMPYTSACAQATARIRADLKRNGCPIGPYDILIAGTAMAHGFVLVTSNGKEFSRIEELEMTDWRSSLSQ